MRPKWYKPAKNTAWRLIDSEILLLNESKVSHALAGTAVEIWNLVIGDSLDTDAATKTLCKRYNSSDPGEIGSDMQEFLDELEKRGFIISSDVPVEPHHPEKERR